MESGARVQVLIELHNKNWVGYPMVCKQYSQHLALFPGSPYINRQPLLPYNKSAEDINKCAVVGRAQERGYNYSQYSPVVEQILRLWREVQSERKHE